jgi:hypothetical protein
MRQAPLLELNDIYLGTYLAKYIVVKQPPPQLLQLCPEHPSHEIWTVLGLLSWI